MNGRTPTDPNQPVVVNVGKSPADCAPKRRGNGITVGAILGVIIAAVGFFGTYVFVTKAELAAVEKATNGGIRKVEKEISELDKKQALTDASVKQVEKKIDSLQIEQRQANENLNKLVRRARMIPVSREDIRIKIEDEEGDP